MYTDIVNTTQVVIATVRGLLETRKHEVRGTEKFLEEDPNSICRHRSHRDGHGCRLHDSRKYQCRNG